MEQHEWEKCVAALDAFYSAIAEGQYEKAYEMLSRREKECMPLVLWLANREQDNHPQRWILTPSRAAIRKVERDGRVETERVAYIRVKLEHGTSFEMLMIQEGEGWKLSPARPLEKTRVLSEVVDRA